MIDDLRFIVQWWFLFFLIGLVFLPFTYSVFHKFKDVGYSYSKIIGLSIFSYIAFVLATLKILPFNFASLCFIAIVLLAINIYLLKRNKLDKILLSKWKIFLFEEILLLTGIAFWSYIRSHHPDLNGLEKFMDFGFVNSILRTEFLPAKDMWFTPFSINYYYFGHFVTALLTKISVIPSFITYNLMLATLFSFSFVLSFSFVSNLISQFVSMKKSILAGLIAGVLVSFSGNLHTIYSLFLPYDVESPVPFWTLAFSPENFPNSYWYPNATRFIPLTIHEFPSYSFVVSDLHGHVIDIIFVLLAIALTYIIFMTKLSRVLLVLISFMIAIMYMTNAWDGLIYLLLISITLCVKNIDIIQFKNSRGKKSKLSVLSTLRKVKRIDSYLIETFKNISSIIVLFVLFSLPFNFFFKPFASGIGVICAPEFLIKVSTLGPFIFEPDHCQTTPWWQFLILYGFFYFFAFAFVIFLLKKADDLKKVDVFVIITIIFSTLLIFLPEFIYVKDIYPAHYRANTMFKLVYQAFILLSLASAYIFVRIVGKTKNILFYIVGFILIFAVVSYPFFSINSYYFDLKDYSGLDGTKYLQRTRPDDYQLIRWINKTIPNQPIIVEAQGDSYTDFGRISSNTGLPTILGWTVHEWLWRGTYDIPAPRIEEVRTIYETPSIHTTFSLLEKYNVDYVVVGNLERERYPDLVEDKFSTIGTLVFESGNTKLFKVSN